MISPTWPLFASLKWRSFGLVAAAALVPSVALIAPSVAQAGLVDTQAIVAQVPLCRVAHAFVKAPCASKLLGDRLLPFVAPIRVTGLKASKTILKLDTDDWKSKAASWINRGLDWLGVPSRYRIPKELKVEVGIGMSLSDVKLALPKGREYQPEFGATIGVQLELLNTPLRGKKFSVKGRVEGRVYLTIAPLLDECVKTKPDWAMAVVNLELTKLNVDKIPDFIDGSDLFISLLNWGLSKMYDDFPQYATRGLSFCIKGKCPGSKPASSSSAAAGGAPAKPGILNLDGLTAQNPYVIGKRLPNGKFDIRLKDAGVLCKVTNDVMTAGCTDAFVNSMANAILPLKVPVPEKLAGPGLTLSADKFQLDLRNPKAPALVGKASITKAGQPGAFAVTLGAKADLNAQCTQDSFMVMVKPRIQSIALSPLPNWLVNGVARSAINGMLKPMDFCFDPIRVKQLGKTINMCKLTDAMLKEQCTAALINGIADAAFPLTVRPAQATFAKDPVLQQLLKGVSLTVQKVKVGVPASDPKKPSVSIDVALRKDGAAGALTTGATATFGVQTKCSATRNAVRVSPFVSNLRVSTIPNWLLKATVIDMGNAAISRWQALCAYGNCKSKQKIDIRMPAVGGGKKPAGGNASAAAPACNFDTFGGGK